jgi:hypothetical protein
MEGIESARSYRQKDLEGVFDSEASSLKKRIHKEKSDSLSTVGSWYG